MGLPVCVWSDNGGQFRNVITAALERSIGMRFRTIPPGHPQSNGLVEVMNRILDFAHGGHRERLISAVLAYNTAPLQKFGVPPETLWRVLRPLESRWKNVGLREVLNGKHREISEEEWLSFLSKDEMLGPAHYEAMASKYHDRLQPVQAAVDNAHLRAQLKKDINYKRKKGAEACPLLAGDRVIVKNSQYTSKTGGGKFECKDGKVREFIVEHNANGVVRIRATDNDQTLLKHESDPKLMPRVVEAESSAVSDPPRKRLCRKQGPP